MTRVPSNMENYLNSLMEQITAAPSIPSNEVLDRLDDLYALLTEAEIQKIESRLGKMHSTTYYQDLESAVEPYRSVCLGNIRRILHGG